MKKLSESEALKLGSTAADLFHLINDIAELNRIKDEVILHLVDNKLQNETPDTCGIFQLYFYKNLFDPLKQSKIINYNKLTKTTILTLLKEIFSTSDKENEQVKEQFAKEHETRRRQKLDAIQGLTISVYQKLLTLDS